MWILVDTSVWIRALGGQASYRIELDRLLARDEVAGHELVYGELLIGDRGGRKKLLVDYEKLQQARIVPHHDLVAFVRHHTLHGRGVGWIDIHLMASAIVEGMHVWTADPRFSAMAKELGVDYDPSSSKT